MNRLRITLNNRKCFVFSAALAALLTLCAGGANAVTPLTVWCVTKTSASPNPSCTASTTKAHIQDAVNDAASGDIIVVGPGKYNESVTINTDSLSLFGAQAGRDAREGRDDPTRESIIDAGTTSNPAISILVPFVVIDGFTIRNGGGTTPAGIYMEGTGQVSGTGLQVVNNIIKDNGVGVFLLYGQGSVVERNRIKDNNNAGTGTSAGYGVVAGFSVASGINDNEFCGNHAAAIAFFFTEFDVVTNNTSDNDGSFLILVETEGGLFSHNRGRNFGAKGLLPVAMSGTPVDADAAVDIGWGNQLLEISNNDLEEGEGSISHGIAFTTIFGTSSDSEGVVVKNNKIKGFKDNGIVAEATSDGTTGMTRYSSIVGNEVEDNDQDGISIEGAGVNNTNISLFDNEAEGNHVFDCQDASTPASGYTPETHNTWFNDIGNLSHPTGLCTRGRGHDHDWR